MCSFTAALMSATRATLVSGEDGPWRQDENAWFDENLRRTLNYAFKALPPAFAAEWALADRIIVAGALDGLWQAVSSRLGVAPRVIAHVQNKALTRAPEASTPLPPPAAKACPRCGKPLQQGKRAHAKWCSASCRTLNAREQAWRKIQPDRSITPDLVETCSPVATATKVAIVEGAPASQLTPSQAVALAEPKQPSVAVPRPEETYLATVSSINRVAIRSGLRTIARILKYKNETECPWGTLTEKQVKRVLRSLWAKYAPSTIGIYVGALGHVLRNAGRDSVAQFAAAHQKKRVTKNNKWWASPAGRALTAQRKNHEYLDWNPDGGSPWPEGSLN